VAHLWKRLLSLSLLSAATAWAGGTAPGDAALAQRRLELDQRFARELAELADACQSAGLLDLAAGVRGWQVPRDRQRQYLFLVPRAGTASPLAAETTEPAGRWSARFQQLRTARAEALFALAADALAAERPEIAYRLLHEVLREAPDHAEARRVLGYRPVGATWRRADEQVQVALARTRHPTLGWLPGRYWRVTSPHYLIATNRGAQAGRELAEQLEELHAVWRQLFFGYWSSQAELSAAWRGAVLPAATRARHRVVLFANRDEYLAHLQRIEPQIELTLGYYHQASREAYFYADDPATLATCLHEATHQLFQESRPTVDGVGEQGSFWIVEGIALYMESLRRGAGYYTVGGVESPRLQFARYRALQEDFYLPLSQLVTLTRPQLQQDPRIRKLYSQSAGWAHFLMDADAGRYQPALIEYLRSVYLGRARAESLPALAGIAAERLDQQYHTFLQVRDDDLAGLAGRDDVASLVLGRTKVTDGGLAHLGPARRLEWLDLAFTTVTDAGVAPLLTSARNLRQLNLEGTQISDAALARLRDCAQLEELDLSGTAITDAGLRHLAALKRLRLLWLTGTRITDAGLDALRDLKALETLDVGGTRVTQSGWRELTRSLPALREP